MTLTFKKVPGNRPAWLLMTTIGLATAMMLAALNGAGSTQTPPLPFGPGVTEITVDDERSDRPLAGDLWYPTTTPDRMSRANKSKVWEMAPADPEGVAAQGPFPLIVVSHGMYGNTRNQAWLASELSRRGYLVAMVNHPGTSSFLRDEDQARELWDRPVDLSRLITYLVKSSAFRDKIDTDRIYAVGHSLGGYTVMLTAGATFDNATYRAACADGTDQLACQVLEGWSIAETEEDRQQMEVSRRDPRISKVISLDLGGTQVFSPVSLAAIDVPVLILGSERADMLDQDVESRALAASLPEEQVQHIELEDAGHFDFMAVCKPDGYAILRKFEPGDEMVCVKGTTEREHQHQRIVQEVLDFLGS